MTPMQLLYQKKKAKRRLWNKQLCSLKTENMMKGIWKYLYTSINSGFTKITKEYRLKFSVFTTKSSTKFDKYNKVFAGNEYEEQGYPCHGVVNFKKMVIFFEKNKYRELQKFGRGFIFKLSVDIIFVGKYDKENKFYILIFINIF